MALFQKIQLQNIHRETLPALRLVGKRYTNFDRLGGGYGAYWGEWHEKGWFGQLEALPHPQGVEHGCLGFMRCNGNDDDFEYWIGTFHPAGTEPPDSYEFLDIPAGEVGVCWLFGKEADGIYSQHEACEKAIVKAGWEPDRDFAGTGYLYFFERYNGERFTADEKNRVILDYGIYGK